MPDDFELAGNRRDFYQNRQLGLGVIELTDDWAEQLGYQDRSGALIFHVDPDRIAAQAGLREGMLIIRVGERRVRSVAEVREAIESESLAEGITLEVQTRRGTQVLKLQSS